MISVSDTPGAGDSGQRVDELPLPVGHTLCGRRVCLRVPARDDLGFIRGMWADAETMEAVGGPVVLSAEEAGRWYARWIEPGSSDRAYWLVTCEGRPVGEISFRCFDPAERVGMLNVKTAACERGRGYAREAVQVVLRYFFEELAGMQMHDDVGLDNAAGQSLILSEGFVRDRATRGVCRLLLTREQWKARHSAK